MTSVEDQFLIRDLLSRYADICSRQAFNELVDLIASDAKITLDLRGSELSFTGPVEIGDFIAESLTASLTKQGCTAYVTAMKFRPCIDLHHGKVKQIVGGTLRDDEGSAPAENFVSDLSAQHYAEMYRRDGLTGG